MELLADCVLNERCHSTRKGTATEASTKETIKQRTGKGHPALTINQEQGHRSRQARSGQGLDSMRQSQEMIPDQGGRVGDGTIISGRPLEASPGISTDHSLIIFVFIPLISVCKYVLSFFYFRCIKVRSASFRSLKNAELVVLHLEDKVESVVANVGRGLVIMLPILGGPVLGGQGTLPVNVQEVVALEDEEGDGDDKRREQYLND